MKSKRLGRSSFDEEFDLIVETVTRVLKEPEGDWKVAATMAMLAITPIEKLTSPSVKVDVCLDYIRGFSDKKANAKRPRRPSCRS